MVDKSKYFKQITGAEFDEIAYSYYDIEGYCEEAEIKLVKEFLNKSVSLLDLHSIELSYSMLDKNGRYTKQPTLIIAKKSITKSPVERYENDINITLWEKSTKITKPIHKFNSGIRATLCNKCRKIITTDFISDTYCKTCFEFNSDKAIERCRLEILKDNEDYFFVRVLYLYGGPEITFWKSDGIFGLIKLLEELIY